MADVVGLADLGKVAPRKRDVAPATKQDLHHNASTSRDPEPERAKRGGKHQRKSRARQDERRQPAALEYRLNRQQPKAWSRQFGSAIS